MNIVDSSNLYFTVGQLLIIVGITSYVSYIWGFYLGRKAIMRKYVSCVDEKSGQVTKMRRPNA